ASGNAEVFIRASRIDNQVEFLVEDNGPGVDPSIKDRLFQAGVSTSGGGLGLYLCKRVVEGYKGSMEYIDGKRGAAFRIRLPIA
ncbi:MAG: ATP-binding protein, partial [Candidatus Thorarchaeota archaeon]|nr:ATP-binding protein [Candidatus Thorarchaeota archaeon]